MRILVINAGSSSLKYQFIDMNDKSVLAKGYCERIGIDGCFTYSAYGGKKYSRSVRLQDHHDAFNIVLETLISGESAVIRNVSEIEAIGHRIVNGGEKFDKSVLVSDQVLNDLEEVVDFAPLHNPAAITLIKACLKTLGPSTPNVLVFDTTFHRMIPAKAYMFGVPYRYYEKYKLRRYGAHGTSHYYVSQRCAERMGKSLSELKIITCHLGNGSSIAAVENGNCIDTSMGLTPLGGLIMGTRSGDLDPSVLMFIMEKEKLTPKEMNEMLNRQSGFLGLSALSSDCREIQTAAINGNSQAKLSYDMFIYQIKKYLGAYAVAMNGIDALVFTAGIGENSSMVRQDVCKNMNFIGIEIDRERNEKTVGGIEEDITADSSAAKIFVIPTNEEYMIALDTQTVVRQSIKQ